jgi:hypothetical protein
LQGREGPEWPECKTKGSALVLSPRFFLLLSRLLIPATAARLGM